jgi:hypothetical protein
MVMECQLLARNKPGQKPLDDPFLGALKTLSRGFFSRADVDKFVDDRCAGDTIG